MVNTEPLKQYIESRDAFKAGENKKALKLLADSVGAPGPTEFMKDNLDKLTEPNDAVLTLIIHQSKEE